MYVLLFLQKSAPILPHDKVPRELEAQPATRHTGRDLEQIWYEALVQPSDAFCLEDGADGIADARVLVAHAGHGVAAGQHEGGTHQGSA